MDYTVDNTALSQEDGLVNTMSSQDDAMDYTMDNPENTMDYTMSHDPTNQTLSQLPDAQDFSEEEEEDDLPVLEFARLVGIARDHQLDDTSVDTLLSMKDDVHHKFTNDMNVRHLSQLNIQADFNTNEGISVSADAVRLLASVAENESQESINSLVNPLLVSRKSKYMRVESPLLLSGHESDFREFARREGFEVKPRDIRFPLELVSVDNNEGLEFPPEFYNFETEMFDIVANEKIEVTKNAMISLHATLKATLTKEDEQQIWETERAHPKKFPVSSDVTPPLSPMYVPPPDSPLPFLPSACEIPLLSDPESLTSLDLKKIEDEVFKEDLPALIRNKPEIQATLSTSDNQYIIPGNLYSPPECIKTLYSISSSIENKRIVMENRKVEEILTPPKPFAESDCKSVHFSNVVETLLLSNKPQSGIPEPTIETKFLEEAFGKSGEQVKRRVEQERLVDTRNRVNVPEMDFSIAGPPWKKASSCSVNAVDSTLQEIVEKISVDPFMGWPGLKNLHAKLSWVPFEHSLGNIAEESVGNEKTRESPVVRPEDDQVVTSSDLIWKRQGFRILRGDFDENDDDELEVGFLRKEVATTSSITGKRKSEMQDVDQRPKQARQSESHSHGDAKTSFRSFITPEIRNKLNMEPASKKARSTAEDQISFSGGIFSMKNALNNFLEIRGVQRPKPTETSPFFAPNVASSASPASPNQATSNNETSVQQTPIPRTHSPVPTPTIIAPSTPIYIILSSAIFKNRPLIRSLQTLLPTLQICERDFSAHNTTTWNPNSVARSPVTSTLTHEADIIISPTTGLILTTLQHIRQKPLPGHKTVVPIRDRLLKVSPRYENLIILAASTSSELGDSDCIAWADFIGFTLTLPASTMVQYIPIDATNPNDQTMAKCISHLIIQNALQSPSPPSPPPSSSPPSNPSPPSSFPSPLTITLLDQESYWELWLRRAGMNAYAAQATIIQLKEPEPRCTIGEEGYENEMRMISERGPYGLTLFVGMSGEERLARLGWLVGRGVLGRVGEVVDRVWG
ncbi:bd2226db-fa51-4f9f-a1b8-80dc2ff12b0c [Sclerotinia trifoliorum]|uniref:Bd2226db-fa51-4f9f-a1b8-80dc2ff12b0c n=1 Tax=Sclerotinia trifoliorum TaxID=28548 RepID=A0A8H2VY41_9HELO|nr:bd2226db-fa51-4f9f-a1b8-80dc2ff12b0c [Sclerotinia trifoliorum]